MATFCFDCFSESCNCGPEVLYQAPFWTDATAHPDPVFTTSPPFSTTQPPTCFPNPPPITARLTPTRDVTQPHESFANECFPHFYQYELHTRLLDLLQQPWLILNQPEPAGAFRFLLHDAEPGKQQCLICSRLYRRGGRATEHIRTHLNHKPFACFGGYHGCSRPVCGKMFHGQEAMKDHQRRDQVQCDKCNLIILRKNYGRHQRSACSRV